MKEMKWSLRRVPKKTFVIINYSSGTPDYHKSGSVSVSNSIPVPVPRTGSRPPAWRE